MPTEAGATPSSSVSALQLRIDELSVELRARTAERDEAMQRERALAEVLQTINASAQVPTAVFDVILERVMRLCAAAFGYLMTYDGERFQVVASHSLPARFAEYLRNMDQPGSTGLYADIRRGSPYGQVADLREGEVYRTSPLRRALVDLGGARTGIVVALRKDDSLLGAITIYRQEVRPFANTEIALLQNFAAQAVIAIDTSRLLGELRDSEARHALVSDAVAEGIYEWNIETNALWVSQRLIEIFGFEGRELKAADWNELVHPEDFQRYRSALRDCFKGTTRRLDCEYRVRHADGAYRWIEDRGVPVRNAAGQAVRLVGALTDVTARKESERALSEALERQTATTEVLQVINSSPGRLEPVFDAMLEKATLLCEADAGVFCTHDGGGRFLWSSVRGFPGMAELPRDPPTPHAESGLGRVVRGETIVHILDSAAGTVYESGDRGRRAIVDLGGARTQLCAGLRTNDVLLGAFIIWRREVRPFSDRQVALLQNFAAQAVIAMENARLINETREALEQQTATADILRIISQSPNDVQPVLNVVAEAAQRFCGAEDVTIGLRQGESWIAAAHLGPMQAGIGEPVPLNRQSVMGRSIIGAETVQVSNIDAVSESEFATAIELARRFGWRAAAAAPLMREGVAAGAILLRRPEAGVFTPRQIELLETFAAQAVIAIENVRLFTELRESLEQQTATAEVLQVISQSPTDVAPVLQAVGAAARRFCGAEDASIFLRDGEEIVAAAHSGSIPALAIGDRDPLGPSTIRGQSIIEGRTVQISDTEAHDPDQYTLTRAYARQYNFRAAIAAPMLRDGRAIGCIAMRKPEPGPFTARQIALLESFAAQAVIAIENVRLFTELREALEQQTATADVLRIISRSSVDLEAVLETLVQTVARLCRADQAYMFRRRDELHHLVASHGASDETREYMLANPFTPDRGNTSGRVVLERRTIHIPDVLADAEYTYREGQTIAGFRTMLGIPLMREETIIGVFVASRTHVDPFSDKEIALATGFADQAMIAIENARLFEELRDRQAELRVTFDNMGDGVAMFDAEPRLLAWNRNFEKIIGLPQARLAERPSYADYLRLLAARGEFGTENVEAELASRLENTDRELRLERTRADGTVIEVRRNAVPGGGFVLIYSDVTEQRRAEAAVRAARDAAEAALERQTATADILKVIASSPTDVQPVLDAVAKAAQRFCGAVDAVISLREDDEIIRAAHEGSLDSVMGRSPIDRSSITGRTIIDARTVHIPDIATLDRDELATTQALAAGSGARAAVAAPLLREGIAVGCILLRKREPGTFAPDQIELLESFAAQAVIAIENVRLFTELKESLEQQTATAEILRAISQSPTDVQPVLDVVAKAAVRFCGATDANIHIRDGDEVLNAAHEGLLGANFIRRPLDRQTGFGTAILEGRTVQIPDIEALDPVQFALSRRLAAEFGFRAALAAPLLREDVAIGAISLRRIEPGAFTQQQIELLETFAAQAVIAIENVRLFTELRDSLERLKAAQANLIQSEKMASLGQLTAGIAHEIKNPLNFVNNFAGLSVELMNELKEVAEPVLAGMSKDTRAEFGETIEMITSNLDKIAEHGRRADGIVKSMLSHSRGGKGDWQQSNINALVEEALNLAYHGARAQDQDFNVTLERDFASEPKSIEVVPQDVTRVFLNLFGNGFYATRKRHLGGADAGYRPTLRVSTRDLGEAVEVKVRDNGTGIPPEVRAKLFQPFFTTKPTGEGTGLGLSISYDIVTQQHGGSIDVESEPGAFTEFTVRLPRRRRAA